MRDPLFFIALLPDEALQQEITVFKNHCAQHFGASHALTSPPHITLVSPFSWKMSDLSLLEDALEGFAASQRPFDIKMSGFGCFPPRVVFVDIVPNPTLSTLAADLAQFLEKRIGLVRKTSHGFNPHATIAHRDLKEAVFQEAWDFFSKIEFRRAFMADGLTLLRHEQRCWQIEETFLFG